MHIEQTHIAFVGPAEGFAEVASLFAGRATTEHVPATGEAVAAALVRADGFIDASMKVRITDAMLESAPRLRIIACATTGSDHIERDVIEQKGISVRTLREDPELLRNLTPAAELSWALLMACARRLPAAVAHVQSGQWNREEFPGVMLNGKTLGLVGCGRIGGWMSRYALAFGMSVLAHDPYQPSLPAGVSRLPLERLMETADFVSIHVHLSDETRGLISRPLLERCKPGLILINTSRGAIVDESALLDGLASGRIGAVGLDVLDGEPDIDRHPLVNHARHHDNVLITPHCGGYSPDAVRRVCAHTAHKIAAALEIPCEQSG